MEEFDRKLRSERNESIGNRIIVAAELDPVELPIPTISVNNMDDRSRLALAVLVGAGLGGAIGYLYLTEAGRRVREQIEPRIDDAVTEIRRWRRIVDKAHAASGEAWRALSDVAGEPSSRPRESARSIR